MRFPLGVVLLLACFVGFTPAKAQPYDQTAVEAHLRALYKYHGDRLLKWDRPVRYIVVGVESEAMKRIIDDSFAYIADLTGLDIQRAAQSGNFIFVFANPVTQVAGAENVRALFGKEGQTDAEYQAMLEELERDGLTRTITRRSQDALAVYAVLANPTVWKDELVSAIVLKLIAFGLTQAATSEEIEPSIFNASAGSQPLQRMPLIDEVFLRDLYRGPVKSGTPVDQALSQLSAAVAADLKK